MAKTVHGGIRRGEASRRRGGPALPAAEEARGAPPGRHLRAVRRRIAAVRAESWAGQESVFAIQPAGESPEGLAPNHGTPLDLRVPAAEDGGLQRRVARLSGDMERFGYSGLQREAAAGFLASVSDWYKSFRGEGSERDFGIMVLATVARSEALFFVWCNDRLGGPGGVGALQAIFNSSLGEALRAAGAAAFYGFDHLSLVPGQFGKGAGVVVWLRMRPDGGGQ